MFDKYMYCELTHTKIKYRKSIGKKYKKCRKKVYFFQLNLELCKWSFQIKSKKVYFFCTKSIL